MGKTRYPDVFCIQQMQTWTLEPFEFHDKMLLKNDYRDLGVRAVPHAVARYGAYIARNVVLCHRM